MGTSSWPLTVCDMCGQSFPKKRPKQRRCSPACVRAYKSQWAHTKNAGDPARRFGTLMHCARCGISLVRTGAMQKYCGACRPLVDKEVFRRSKGAADRDVFGATFSCVICGKSAIRTGPRQKYCSKACYDSWMRDRQRKKHNRTFIRGSTFACRGCGKLSTRKRGGEKYCSVKCCISHNKVLRRRKHLGEGGIPYTRRQILSAISGDANTAVSGCVTMFPNTTPVEALSIILSLSRKVAQTAKVTCTRSVGPVIIKKATGLGATINCV